MTRWRWAALAVLVLAVVFALQGGEYSTGDWLTLRRQTAEEQAAVTGLQAAIDSLRKVAHALETDPVAQERTARDKFGMLRQGEFLYRLVPAADSTEP